MLHLYFLVGIDLCTAWTGPVSCAFTYTVSHYLEELCHISSCMLVNHGASQQSCKEEYVPWK